MKVLILSRYTRLGASSRLRMVQYRSYLEAAGLEVEVEPFFDDSYLIRQYSGQSSKGSGLGRFLPRLRRLIAGRRPDVMWLEKEALPWVPWALERLALPRSVPIVSDYDDAVFHQYDRHPRTLVRYVLGRKLDHLMAGSALVMAGNAYLAERAQAAGARRIEIVPTVLDIKAYDPVRRSAPDGRPRIGWIGTPGTWTTYGQPMLLMLGSVAEEGGALIRVVGAAATGHPAIEARPWAEASEVAEIQGMDVGIMPLDDSPWARGKCGYKLIQYMACGLPVVASPVGVNAEIVEHGVNGFLVTTEAEWHKALTTLLRNPDLRRRMGMAGRRKVMEQYSLQKWGPLVAALLRDVAEGRPV